MSYRRERFWRESCRELRGGEGGGGIGGAKRKFCRRKQCGNRYEVDDAYNKLANVCIISAPLYNTRTWRVVANLPGIQNAPSFYLWYYFFVDLLVMIFFIYFFFLPTLGDAPSQCKKLFLLVVLFCVFLLLFRYV